MAETQKSNRRGREKLKSEGWYLGFNHSMFCFKLRLTCSDLDFTELNK